MTQVIARFTGSATIISEGEIASFSGVFVLFPEHQDSAGSGAPVMFKLAPDNHILIIARAIYGSINGYAKIDLIGSNIWKRADRLAPELPITQEIRRSTKHIIWSSVMDCNATTVAHTRNRTAFSD